jgi:hypothetical protein
VKKRAKKLQKDLCRVVGHEFSDDCSTCSRCGYKKPRYILPTFEISSNLKVKWADTNFRKYDILDRAKSRIKADFQKDIDKKLFDEMQ